MKILIVEDTEIHTTLMRFMLKEFKKGEVVSAKDAFEAYAILKAICDIDILIVDYNLPYVSGGELIRKIRDTKAYEHLSIVVSSAEDDIGRLVDVGTYQILKKPYSREALVSTIRKLAG